MNKHVWGWVPVIAAACAVALTGCSGGDDQAADGAAESSVTASGPSTPTTWTGTWESGEESNPAILSVSSTDPLLATLDINPARCGATWTEESREGDTVVVAAKVTYGDCRDNRWEVKITDEAIVATDVDDPDTWVELTRTGNR